MNTLQQRWQEYKDAVYPEPIPAIQNKECHQAFMAGAMTALAAMRTLSELPEDEAVKELEKLFQEATGFSALHAFAMKLRN